MVVLLPKHHRFLPILICFFIFSISTIFPITALAGPNNYYCVLNATATGCDVNLPTNCDPGYILPNAPPDQPCKYTGVCTPDVANPAVCVPGAAPPPPLPPNPCAAGHVDTGIGCLPYNYEKLAETVVRLVVGVAGGIALVILIVGGAQFVASRGDPDAIDEARGKISAALSGLLLIIFSLVVLKVIGIDILGLPEFSVGGGGEVTLPGTPGP